MNILFFSRLFSPHIGGVEKHILEISTILIKEGHRVTVVTEKHSEDLKLKENVEGIEVFRIPSLTKGKLRKFQIWKWIWINSKLIKSADVVHCHDVFFWYLPFRFLFPFKRVFTTFHGYEGYPLKQKDIIIHKISETLSNGNICIGDFIGKWYGTKPTFVSYGGVNIPNLGMQIKSTSKKESAVFIGRLEEQTGILTYVEAVKIIKKKIPGFDFLIIGDGDLKSEIGMELKMLKATSNAPKYYKNFNFAFVSRYLSILEAIAARKLVFAVYDNPIKEDYLRMAPFAEWVVIVSSAEGIAERAISLLNNPNKSKIITEKAFEWVKDQSWGNLVKIYLKLWG